MTLRLQEVEGSTSLLVESIDEKRRGVDGGTSVTRM